ncbi:GbNV_gp67-like [Fopius arisanus]|uniref:Gek_0 protein n=1 Tax=Fopius arisanus TaxID=64838 RepID=A0A0C9QYQ2_9HYME|nr:GbNV_gp67-like [Fopius arisanus]
MDIQDAFKRAALYESCKQSNILSHIDLENTDTESLVELVNHNNAHSIRELPIIVSKFVTKGLLTLAIHKAPHLQNFIDASKIRICVEEDEMAFLVATSTSVPTSLTSIVIKNIAINALGTSIAQMKADLLNTTSGGSNYGKSPVGIRSKIRLTPFKKTEFKSAKPSPSYSSFGDYPHLSSKPGDKRPRSQGDEHKIDNQEIPAKRAKSHESIDQLSSTSPPVQSQNQDKTGVTDNSSSEMQPISNNPEIVDSSEGNPADEMKTPSFMHDIETNGNSIVSHDYDENHIAKQNHDGCAMESETQNVPNSPEQVNPQKLNDL